MGWIDRLMPRPKAGAAAGLRAPLPVLERLHVRRDQRHQRAQPRQWKHLLVFNVLACDNACEKQNECTQDTACDSGCPGRQDVPERHVDAVTQTELSEFFD